MCINSTKSSYLSDVWNRLNCLYCMETTLGRMANALKNPMPQLLPSILMSLVLLGTFCARLSSIKMMPTEILIRILIYSNSFRYGEVVPLGTNYLASYASGVRVGLKELCPKLIGQDPTQIKVINDFMDFHLKGHPYVKSPIDMACWDILGKVIAHSEFFFLAILQWDFL